MLVHKFEKSMSKSLNVEIVIFMTYPRLKKSTIQLTFTIRFYNYGTSNKTRTNNMYRISKSSLRKDNFWGDKKLIKIVNH